MAISRLVNLFALSSLALFICSLTQPAAASALAHADSPFLARHHVARSHDVIAKKKRNAKSKRCKNRPTSLSSSVEAASTTSSSSSSSSSTHQASSTPAKNAAPAPTSSSAPAPSHTASSSGGGGGSGDTGAKPGLAWPNGNQFLSSWNVGNVKAMYTWSPACPSDASKYGFECYPMCWGWNQKDQFQQTAVEGYSTIAMGFNEPNEPGQSNMSPESGAQLWQEVMEPLKSKGYRLVSPVTSSNPNGFTWVQNFFTACNGGCNPDIIALHWYDNTAQKFIDYVEKWHNAYPDKEIWVTEFACQNFNGPQQCTSDEIFSFMSTVTAWMESQPYIGHYFAFGAMQEMQGVNPLDSLMNSDGTPSSLGWVFLNS